MGITAQSTSGTTAGPPAPYNDSNSCAVPDATPAELDELDELDEPAALAVVEAIAHAPAEPVEPEVAQALDVALNTDHGKIGPGNPGWAPGDAAERDAALRALWDQFKADGSKELRDRLLVHYSPLVKFVAGRVGASLPLTIETADLMSYGIFGLIDAINKFQPERQFKFETYAMSRIRGQIIDELRSVDWVPRSVRSKARDIERAYVALETELHRTPDEEEVAAHLNIDVKTLRHICGQVSFTSMAALDELMHSGREGQEGLSLGETLADTRAETPGEALDNAETKRLLNEAVSGLPSRDKIVITLYYYEGLTLAEIGQVLGVTESRVCQMHTKATLALRAKMTAAASE